MLSRTQALALLALLSGARALSAQETSGPPAELSQLSSFVGNWQCTGQLFPRESRKGHATEAAGHASKAVDGRWIQFSYEERKTAANPTPYHVTGYMGYDASKKQFVQTIVDNYGTYGPSFSQGWKGDTMMFEGTSEANGKPILGRDYFVRKGQHAFVHFSEAQAADGKWLKPDEETCNLGTQ
jgi:hypothetical protein